MSRAFNDHIENIQEQREREYVASALSIDPETLDEHPYRLEENANNDGAVTSWLLYWEDSAPEGVSTHGAEGSLWTSIAPDNSDDSDYEPDDE